MPLNQPNSAATITGTVKASAIRQRWVSIGTIVPRKIIGASAPEIAISEPTERSMPPVAITSVMPVATMTMVATWVRFTLSVCQRQEIRRDGDVENDQRQESDQRAVAAEPDQRTGLGTRRRGGGRGIEGGHAYFALFVRILGHPTRRLAPTSRSRGGRGAKPEPFHETVPALWFAARGRGAASSSLASIGREAA